MKWPAPRPVCVSATTPVERASLWRVVADPGTYQSWVAGTAVSGAGRGRWPQVGATLRHRWGLPGLRVTDHTTVVGSSPGAELRMCAQVRPIARVAIEIRLFDEGGGTRVELCETVVGGPALWFPFITVPIQRARNRRSLRHLVALADGAAPDP